MILKILLITTLIVGLILTAYGAKEVYCFMQISSPTPFEEGRRNGAVFVGFIGIVIIFAMVKKMRKKS